MPWKEGDAKGAADLDSILGAAILEASIFFLYSSKAALALFTFIFSSGGAATIFFTSVFVFLAAMHVLLVKWFSTAEYLAPPEAGDGIDDQQLHLSAGLGGNDPLFNVVPGWDIIFTPC